MQNYNNKLLKSRNLTDLDLEVGCQQLVKKDCLEISRQSFLVVRF
ncbi:hypothetical protein HMPREF1551_00931 [Capnocytophaga sp. oral taxon 863 str. F0517]|nr:hypothetical protein HMPREF1551_00931 [Capnocytophaga sp. oral taxon 863 str. F0517]